MFSKWIFPDNWTVLVIAICSVLHQRSARRLGIIIAGIVFARGRRTVTSWFRAAGITKQYKAFYYFIGSIGRKTETIATILFEIMLSYKYVLEWMGHSLSAVLDMYFTMNDRQAQAAMNGMSFNSEKSENRTVPGQSGAHFREALPQPKQF